MARHWSVLSKGSDLTFKRNTPPDAQDSGRGGENGKEAATTNQARGDGGGDPGGAVERMATGWILIMPRKPFQSRTMYRHMLGLSEAHSVEFSRSVKDLGQGQSKQS